MRIYQLLPSLALGDGVGNDTRALDALLKREGYTTGIFADNIDLRLPEGTAKYTKEMPELTKNDILLYHGATGSPLHGLIPKLKCRKVMIYHNITPPKYFHGYAPVAERLCAEGLREIAGLRDTFEACLADSQFNKNDLVNMGYRCPITVRPILIPFEDYDRTPDAKMLDRLHDGATNLLFVGRLAPNKKQEDLLRAFKVYHEHLNPNSRLILAGHDSGLEAYGTRLKNYAEALEIDSAVYFTGHIPFPELLACYSAADAFVCASEHEGFCIPLLEAIHFSLPVIAVANAAVPDTLGRAGLQLPTSDPALFAAAIHRVLSDAELKETLIEGEQARLADFATERVEDCFLSWLHDFIA